LQEQLDREAIGITLKASRLTAKALAAAFKAVVRKIQKVHREAQTPHGRQSVKKLMNHNQATNTIPIEGDRGLFDRIARKWNVDYAFHKTGPSKFLLLFKSGQSDAITAAFSEYSAHVVRMAKDRRPPIKEQFKQAAELAERERPAHKERTREREAARE
jgi:hypothetical protein